MRPLLLLAVLLLLPNAAAWTVTVEVDVLRVVPGLEDEGEVTLVLSHDDPVVGEVADRVVPLLVGDNETALVEVDALPQDVDVSVRVVPPEVPVLPERGRVLEEAAKALPVTMTLPPTDPVLGVGDTHMVVGHPVTTQRGVSGPYRLFPYDDGRVGVLWTGVRGDPEQPPDGPAEYDVQYAVSHDDGRTFDAPVALSETEGNSVMVHDAVLRGDVLWAAVRTPDGLNLARHEDGVVTTRTLPVDKGVGQALVAVDDGVLLMVGHWSPNRLAMHRIDADGDITSWQTEELDLNDFWSFQAHAEGDRVLLAWPGRDGLLRTAWSLDGGRSLEPVRTLEWDVGSPWQVLVDALGVGHVTTSSIENSRPEEGPMGADGYLLTVPVVGEVEVRLLNGRLADEGRGGLVPASYWAELPRMATDGHRLWLAWKDPNYSNFDADGTDPSQAWGIESLDLGRTFGSPYRIDTVDGRVAPTSDLGVLPDGRPATVGFYWYSDGSAGLSYVPFLEVRQDVESVLTRVLIEPEGAKDDEGTGMDPVEPPGQDPDREPNREPAEGPVDGAQGDVADASRPGKDPESGDDDANGSRRTSGRDVPAPAVPFLVLTVGLVAVLRRRA